MTFISMHQWFNQNNSFSHISLISSEKVASATEPFLLPSRHVSDSARLVYVYNVPGPTNVSGGPSFVVILMMWQAVICCVLPVSLQDLERQFPMMSHTATLSRQTTSQLSGLTDDDLSIYSPTYPPELNMM